MIPLLDVPARDKLPAKIERFFSEKMPEALALMVALRTLLEDHWAQDSFAKNGAGKQCDIFQEQAEAFCIAGGAVKVAGINPPLETLDLYVQMLSVMDWYAGINGYQDVIYFNDHKETGHADVLLFVDKLISYMRKLNDEQERGRDQQPSTDSGATSGRQEDPF